MFAYHNQTTFWTGHLCENWSAVVSNTKSKDARDLFYSFHYDEVFADSVKHSCIVHFVPENKQIPNRKEYPGLIVQKVYNIALEEAVEVHS